ncbi:hypothetical protein C2857_004250 [Epichloe festucae Fl1]|uniref:Gamma-butyrobetaine dioxygenase n=1 Tax=Epichloe festucae (strain Fl1) TaxID=877507 RepID=A0A7S9KP32_EPIFF|nr:hypothetical protein C2857_004250 [Epichloe festucae Fl1]
MLAPTRAVASRRHLATPKHVLRQCLRQNRQSRQNRQVTTSSQAASASASVPEGAPQLVYRPKEAPDDAVTVSWTREHIYLRDGRLEHGHGAQRALEPATLRDSCACAACKDPSSGQKSFASTEIPADIGIASARATEHGLGITFSNDVARFASQGHEMILPWSHIQSALRRRAAAPRRDSRREAVLGRTGVRYWDARVLAQHVRKIDYAAFMKPGSPAFWDVVIDILRLGIVYLRNVPRDESSVVSITTRIANIRETFYGRTFDVRAKPNAENVAYTSGRLGLHQDLCYLSPPPMIQVLHCMDNSCSGGESLFSDGERAGRLLWPLVKTSRRMAPLAEHPVPYQYDKHGYFYRAERTVIDGDGDGDGENGFAGVYWSPPFQGRYRYEDSAAATVDLRDWIAPARVFEGLVNHPDAVHSYKMEQGECVLFDNLRVMHGRNAFDAAAGGARWLRGAYIAAEDFLSRAAYIPAGQAEMYRGTHDPWTPEVAQRHLRSGQWYDHVVRRVRDVDPSIDV